MERKRLDAEGVKGRIRTNNLCQREFREILHKLGAHLRKEIYEKIFTDYYSNGFWYLYVWLRQKGDG